MSISCCSCVCSGSIGKKYLMAGTGILLVLFVIAHLLGNLQIFFGQEVFNRYAAFLKSTPGALWTARVGLLAVFFAHVITAFQLKRQNEAARPVQYAYESTVQATLASRTMVESGLLILAFIILHLLHYTIGTLQPEYFHLTDSLGRHDVYSMVIFGFSNPYYSGIYCIAMILLGMHLSHALQSVLQTLGFNHPRYTPKIKMSSGIVAWAIALAYMSIPLSVLLGLVSLPAGA